MVLACYHCSTSLVMAGSMPAAHVWHKIIAVWVGVVIVAALLSDIMAAEKTSARRTVELLAAIVLGLGGGFFTNFLYMFIGPWFIIPLFVGITLVWLLVCAGRSSFKMTPLVTGVHIGFTLLLLLTHAYYGYLQHRDGPVFYALRHGTGPAGLADDLAKMPLADLAPLVDRSAILPKEARTKLMDAFESRWSDTVQVSEPGELQDLLQRTTSPTLRARLEPMVKAGSK